MKGYAYINIDNEIIFKTKDYIEEDNPGFYNQNSHVLLKQFKVDSDDKDSILRVLSAAASLKVSVSIVQDFCKSIGFDLNILKKNKNAS